MRIIVNIDDELMEQTQKLTGISEKATLLREGIIVLIERESARRLARLGGTEDVLEHIERRRLAH